jgi:hypothetical protein
MTTKRQMILSRARAAVTAFVLTCAGHAAAQVLGPPPSAAQTPTAVVPSPVPGVLPSPDWRASLAELKLAPRGDIVRKKHHMEVDATSTDGRRVVVSFDLKGRVWETEDEFHDKNRYGDHRAIDPAVAVQAAARAGFAEPSAVEVKKNHTVVRVRTQKGETVDLHIDRGGYIYKQVWVRPWQ